VWTALVGGSVISELRMGSSPTFTTLVQDVLSEVSFIYLIFDSSSVIRSRMTSDGRVLARGALATRGPTIKDSYCNVPAAGTCYAQPKQLKTSLRCIWAFRGLSLGIHAFRIPEQSWSFLRTSASSSSVLAALEYLQRITSFGEASRMSPWLIDQRGCQPPMPRVLT
jgi:hypothetical protein